MQKQYGTWANKCDGVINIGLSNPRKYYHIPCIIVFAYSSSKWIRPHVVVLLCSFSLNRHANQFLTFCASPINQPLEKNGILSITGSQLNPLKIYLPNRNQCTILAHHHSNLSIDDREGKERNEIEKLKHLFTWKWLQKEGVRGEEWTTQANQLNADNFRLFLDYSAVNGELH